MKSTATRLYKSHCTALRPATMSTGNVTTTRLCEYTYGHYTSPSSGLLSYFYRVCHRHSDLASLAS